VSTHRPLRPFFPRWRAELIFANQQSQASRLLVLNTQGLSAASSPFYCTCKIVVATPGGTLTSNVSFRIIHPSRSKRTEHSSLNPMFGSRPSRASTASSGRNHSPPMQDTNGTFYGTTYAGGRFGSGTVYSLNMGLGPFVRFVQPTGRVGQTAQILGQGLTGATSVTFNGVSATSFKVGADTFMTAVVPSGAREV
jgi:uncharacterized repeat protein (TIGR03803 family)